MWVDEKVSATHPAFTEQLPNGRTLCSTHSDFEKVPCLAGDPDIGNKSSHCVPAEEERSCYLGSEGNLCRRGEL